MIVQNMNLSVIIMSMKQLVIIVIHVIFYILIIYISNKLLGPRKIELYVITGLPKSHLKLYT
jgi:hypothetical protein